MAYQNMAVMPRRSGVRTPQAGMSGANPGGMPGRNGGVAARPPQGAGIDGAIQNQMQRFLTGGMQQPMGASIPRSRLQTLNAKPAWQQLQAMGVGGQGSAAANQAKLQEMMGKQKLGMAGGDAPTSGMPQPGTTMPMGAPPPGADMAVSPEAPMTSSRRFVPDQLGGVSPQQMGGPQDGGAVNFGPPQGAGGMSTPSFGGADPAIHQRLLQQAFGGGSVGPYMAAAAGSYGGFR